MNTFTKVLNNGALKGFKDKILLKFPATPLTIESYTLNHEGSLTGWSFVNNPFPAVFKFGQVTKSVLTGIPNISQCGQWTFNPAGIPIAALTGKIASDRVVKIFKRKKK
jgi:phytoene dehydrogenase-like protein